MSSSTFAAEAGALHPARRETAAAAIRKEPTLRINYLLNTGVKAGFSFISLRIFVKTTRFRWPSLRGKAGKKLYCANLLDCRTGVFQNIQPAFNAIGNINQSIRVNV